jgi:hypothetical protein
MSILHPRAGRGLVVLPAPIGPPLTPPVPYPPVEPDIERVPDAAPGRHVWLYARHSIVQVFGTETRAVAAAMTDFWKDARWEGTNAALRRDGDRLHIVHPGINGGGEYFGSVRQVPIR